MSNRGTFESDRDAYAKRLAASGISNEEFHAALAEFDREGGLGDSTEDDEELDLGEDHYGRNL